MARVHLFSSTPHNEKRRRISNITTTSVESGSSISNTNNNNDKRTNELSRLAQLNQGPIPTLFDDTNTLDITAVPSPSPAHSTSAVHSRIITTTQNANTAMNESTAEEDSTRGRPETALPLQNTASDMDLVNAFAAALSGKPESLQLIWDRVRRSSLSNDDSGQQQGDVKGKDQALGTNSAEAVDQEAATALQLLGLASSSSETATIKRPSVDKSQGADSMDKSSNSISDDVADEGCTVNTTSNATAAAAAAVLRQALAQQQNLSNQQSLHQVQQHSDSNNDNNINSALSATMLMANYPGLTSSTPGAEGLELQEEIMQDYKRGTWTREEDELLLMGIKRFGYGRWKEIASTIPGRKGKQLKQRWDNTLASKYVDAELLQNKLRHDEQLTKLQQHLEELATGRFSGVPSASTGTIDSSPALQTTTTSATPSSSDHTKSSTPAASRVDHADWTEIAHKITEKVREGDQEAIEALLSQALLGTSHSLESTQSTQSPAKQEEHISTSTTTSPPTSTNTTNDTTSTHISVDTTSPRLGYIPYSRPTTPITTITPTSSSGTSTSVLHPTSATTTGTDNMNPTPGTSPSQQHNASIINYADAAAFSLYQQLSQQQHTTNDNDSNGANNPLASIQALANNQYFLSNLFANVENGGSDNTNAALVAAAAAAAAAMAHAAAGNTTGTTNTTTDVPSLLASTMRTHLNTAAAAAAATNHHGNAGGNTLLHGGPNNTKHLNNDSNHIGHTTATKHVNDSSSPTSKVGLTSQHKRRRSDPALADTQSEAMSIYASSAPVTTMVNNQPQTVYPCLFPGCGKAFARLYNLKSHSRTHTDDRPFNCQLCNTAFSRNHDLKRHLKTHVGEKPYKCAGCQKTFSRLDALKRHKSNARNQAVCLDA